MIHPVLLSGGSGTRLWPASRALYPKQLLPLLGPRTLLQETALRLQGAGFAPPTVICNEVHRFIVLEQLAAVGAPPRDVVLEPAGRNTAPAITAAALLLSQADPEAVMLVAPSDHRIADRQGFLAAVALAEAAAQDGALVTFGVRPDRAETGYGYIRPKPHPGDGAAGDGPAGVHAIEAFVEKPDADTARAYVESGDYLWNSGMFAFRADAFLGEVERLRPDIVEACHRAVDGAVRDLDFLRLDAAAFGECPSVSVDYAVMEHTGRARVVPVDIGWSDVGSWSTLWTVSDKDAAGNAVRGDVIARDVRNSYLSSDGPLLAAIGVEDLVVVASGDVTLVASREHAERVKQIAEELKQAGRPEADAHATVYRPWGAYTELEAGERFKVKQIVVKPGQKLSLQFHHHRAEHWIVVQGTARVTRGDETFMVYENESTFIPIGAPHRLENPGKVPLRLIEVQSGAYLGEDDIVRMDDVYGR